MGVLIRDATEVVEGRVIQLTERPVTFERFLDIASDKANLELVGGVLVEHMAAQYDHERLFAWLFFLLNGYVRGREIGVVLGSRSAVQITEYDGRLPDILFVSRERTDIIAQRAIYGAPDLVIELVSPNDRPSDVLELETDYRSIGVREIVFVDRRKRETLTLLRGVEGYAEERRVSGALRLHSVPGFQVELAWLFSDDRPNEVGLLNAMLAASDG